jgi:predicted amidophosphoribosyltransferase
MYCKDCKEFFNEPIVTPMEQETGYVGQFCPHCGSDYIEETHPCKCCGEDTIEENEFCDDCMEQLIEELQDLQKRFDVTAEVLEDMICEYYGY